MHKRANSLIQVNLTEQIGAEGLRKDIEDETGFKWFGETLEQHHQICLLMANYFSGVAEKINCLREVLDLWNENLSGNAQNLIM